MAATETLPETPAVPAWRLFLPTVAAVERRSPSFVRLTLTGEDLDHFADLGYDARVKVVLPLPGAGYAHLPREEPWYAAWRALPDEHRCPIRTYTTRAVRRPGGPVPPVHGATTEVVVDMVVHGDSGPASRWVLAARPGDPLALLGPDRRAKGPHGGVEFTPPGPGCPVLLAGDETAVPAVSAILERLPDDATGEALLEVPDARDRWALVGPPGVRVTWLPRGDGAHGSELVAAVQGAAARLHAGGPAGADVEEDVAEEELLWEVAEGGTGTVTAWLAGEASVIRTLRRHLVRDLGMDRRSVSFMGYWRTGRSEGA